MSGSLRRQRLQRALVVAQVGVSVILLTCAGLLTRTMLELADVDAGLRAPEVLTMEVPLSAGPRADAETKALYDRMKLEIGAIPGVTEVGLGSTMPLRPAGIRLKKGREFTSTDRDSTARVVILNETLAKRLFGDSDPINRRVAWTGDVPAFIPASGYGVPGAGYVG